MQRQTRAVLALAGAAVLLGGQWLLQQPKGQRSELRRAGTRVEHFRLGHLDFLSCKLKTLQSGVTTAAWCASFIRPENPADPTGRKIHLRLALIRSPAVRPAPDLVVFLAGGPGQSAIDTWPQTAPALRPVLEHRDVVLLDQRGTGGSHPLTCPKAKHAARTARARQAARSKQQETTTQRHALQAAMLRSCLAEIEKTSDPRDFTTTDFVDDLIALRHELGDPRFDLVGVSYGTLVAQQFAMRDPAGVRSLVLDSVVPNALILGESVARNLQDALKADFSACDTEPACVKAFGNPYSDLEKLRARLLRHPVVVAFRDPVTNVRRSRTLNENTLALVVRLFAYSPLTAALLPLTLHQALLGNYAPLMGQSELVSGAIGISSINPYLGLSVVCTEDVPWFKPKPTGKGTLLGTRFVRDLRRECSIWPRGRMPTDFHQPLQTDLPTLILEGQDDPVTPPRYGREVLAHLSDARLLIARGQGHAVIDAGCMPRLVSQFIAHLEPKTLDARCLDSLRRNPPFVNFNGPTP